MPGSLDYITPAMKEAIETLLAGGVILTTLDGPADLHGPPGRNGGLGPLVRRLNGREFDGLLARGAIRRTTPVLCRADQVHRYGPGWAAKKVVALRVFTSSQKECRDARSE